MNPGYRVIVIQLDHDLNEEVVKHPEVFWRGPIEFVVTPKNAFL